MWKFQIFKDFVSITQFLNRIKQADALTAKIIDNGVGGWVVLYKETKDGSTKG